VASRLSTLATAFCTLDDLLAPCATTHRHGSYTATARSERAERRASMSPGRRVVPAIGRRVPPNRRRQPVQFASHAPPSGSPLPCQCTRRGRPPSRTFRKSWRIRQAVRTIVQPARRATCLHQGSPKEVQSAAEIERPVLAQSDDYLFVCEVSKYHVYCHLSCQFQRSGHR
jgi:hypothetical protein